MIEAEGGPWFVLTDVCRVLEHSNPSVAADRLDADEKGVSTVYTLGGNQETTIINESGLYSLILTSRKFAAKRFKKWVTSEVLPAIRKTGSYGQAVRDPMEVLNDPAAMRGLLLGYSEKVLALENKVAEQKPKVDALDRISTADGSVCISNTAKLLQMRPKDLFTWLAANRWIYRRAGMGTWLGYQDKVQAGLLEHKVTTVNVGGADTIREQVLVTSKGLARLATETNLQGRAVA